MCIRDRTEDVRIMGEKMDHLNNIVEQILTFARNAEPQFKPSDVNKIINDLRILVRRKFAQQKVVLDIQLAENLPEAKADKQQLSQVFLNLTLNALEAMPNGGELKIKSSSTQLQKNKNKVTNIQIDFSDTGSGMNSELRKKAFTSLLNSSKPGGTGIGLAIVNRIIESHGGEIKIRPNVKGTTFSVYIPIFHK